tara:strand:- start:244 stop:1023 length:780 start_codon:yes stop_codon:yes gene_type:complete
LSHRFLAVLIVLICAAPMVSGHERSLQENDFDDALLRVEEGSYLGQIVPDVAVATESGTKHLSALIAGQPTILLFAYYTCGHACPLAIANLSRMLVDVETPHRVIVVSFDAKDNLDTLHQAQSTLTEIPDEWTFGLLAAKDSERLTESVGFNFFFSERDQMFIHPSVLVFLSPQGEVMRYLYGDKSQQRDIELALIQSRNRVPRLNELADIVKLTCFQFDASRSRYVIHPTLIFGGAGFGVLGITGLATLAYKRDSKRG